jgi:hypothetical protein
MVVGGKLSTEKATAAAIAISQNVTRMEFHIHDRAGMKVPDYYTPDRFSDYARGLVERWASCLIELAILTGKADAFSIGFVFADDCLAECSGGVLLVNPVTITEREGKPRSMARGWTFNNQGNWDLVATAAHEWVHFEGLSLHDENYSSRLTEIMGMVLTHRDRFGKIFCGQGRIKWKS